MVRIKRNTHSQLPCRLRTRRGTVLVALVAFILIAELVLVGFVLNAGRHQYLAVDRLQTVRAFYSTEGGMNMAVREIMLNADEDGDGGIGSISDDGDPADDPKIGAGFAYVSQQLAGTTLTLKSTGRAGESVRLATAILEY